MIDIFTTGGSLNSIDISIDMMDILMQDDIIGDADFIPLKFTNGYSLRVRKRDICSYCEHFEEDDIC